MPATTFKYVYLDALISDNPKPSERDFSRKASIRMDTAKEQIYLWYAFRNPVLAKNFLARANLGVLLDRNEDAINAILWLMSPVGRRSTKQNKVWTTQVLARLTKWRERYRKVDPARSTALDFYNDDISFVEYSKMTIPSTDTDVDALLHEGIIHEKDNKKIDALSFYTRVADYGFKAGLVGAALLLPQVGGLDCLQRAKYYVMLSGTVRPITWWTVPELSGEK